jgi:predicted enzyme related to lactoylglutathione lyase
MKNSYRFLTTTLLFAVLCTPASQIARGQAMSANPDTLSKVSMVVIGVTDLSKSIRFYRDTLGLTVTNQNEEFVTLSAATIDLVLSGPLGRSVKPGSSSIEIVFPVESVSTIHRLLTARGCEFIRQPREITTGSWAATLKDPDGHLLTLFGGK